MSSRPCETPCEIFTVRKTGVRTELVESISPEMALSLPPEVIPITGNACGASAGADFATELFTVIDCAGFSVLGAGTAALWTTSGTSSSARGAGLVGAATEDACGFSASADAGAGADGAGAVALGFGAV